MGGFRDEAEGVSQGWIKAAGWGPQRLEGRLQGGRVHSNGANKRGIKKLIPASTQFLMTLKSGRNLHPETKDYFFDFFLKK